MTNFEIASASDELKLECRFLDLVLEPDLAPLLPIIRELLRFRPGERISASEALELLQY